MKRLVTFDDGNFLRLEIPAREAHEPLGSYATHYPSVNFIERISDYRVRAEEIDAICLHVVRLLMSISWISGR